MDSSREHFESQQPAVGGLSNMKTVQKNTAASVAELREFLGQLKGRSPQEVMGIVAQSSLVQGIGTALVGTCLLLIVFTVGPYLMYGPPEAQAVDAANTLAEATQQESDDSSPDSASDTTKDADTAAPTSSEPDVERAAQAMGIDEVKDADPDKNPLDSKLDQLLDGIE